jgi:hypothetical protein
MSQVSIPSSDVATGMWTPLPVYQRIKTPAPPDITFVTSGQNPTGDSFKVNLSPVCVPSNGPGTLFIRLQNTTSTLLNTTVVLWDAGTFIASWNILAPANSFTTYPLAVTAAQVELINNFDQLQLQVFAGGILTTCCPNNPFPAVLHVTITNVSGCDCLAGKYPLVWGGSFWTYNGLVCGGNALFISLGTNCFLTAFCGAQPFTITPVGSPNCSLPSLSYTAQTGNSSCCLSGTVTAVVTT